ncbi:MAG: isochorismatase family protein [Nocardia sp.]|nr:isochorismatase family protein [Nocardia sp.]
MAIAPIAPYSLPAMSQVAGNRTGWDPDADRAVLLIHDMQEYFIRAYQRDREPMRTALANMVRLRERCHELGIPVVYTMQPGNQHPSRRGLLADFWGAGMTNGPDTRVVPELLPTPADIQVVKWRYSAFQRTDMRELLSYEGRDQLIVTGVYAHMGCMLSAAEAFMNDVQPFLVLDATADFSADDHRMAADYVARRCGVVVETEALLTAFRHSRAAARTAIA